MSMPMVATAVPKIPPTLRPSAPVRLACEPSQWLANRAMPMETAATNVVSKPTATPEMMFVAGPGRDAGGAALAGRLHHHVRDEGQGGDGQQGRHPVAAVEHVHGVLVLAAADEED